MRILQILACLLLPALLSTASAQESAGASEEKKAPQQTPEQLQQLVAPIALYPDSLVAQILAASTFPEQVVVAERWLQGHPGLKGDALGHAVDQEPWDASVKALTAFPSVLGNMDKNLSWTSSLGDAYYNQQPEVMDAIQVMRWRAQQASDLKSTPQQTVETQDSKIVIQPANSVVVYVPAYDPWVVYGEPVVAWPGWYAYPGIWYEGAYVSWGVGFEVGWYWGFGWGWNSWGCDWHHRYATYNHGRYYSHSRTFYNRGNYYRGGERHEGDHHSGESRGSRETHGSRDTHSSRYSNSSRDTHSAQDTHSARDTRGAQDTHSARGYAESRGQSGVRSGAFSGYGHGGEERGFSSRGSSSVGGGGFSRGGGGGGGAAHAGGFGGGHGGGGRR